MVESIKPILAPYKLVSREMHPHDTVVRFGKAAIGGRGFTVIAGPCAVETRELNGYRVVFIRFAGGKPVGKPMNFVAGFLNRDGNARGRPVGVAFDRTGALIIADDVGGTVWRVSYVGRAGTAPAANPG